MTHVLNAFHELRNFEISYRKFFQNEPPKDISQQMEKPHPYYYIWNSWTSLSAVINYIARDALSDISMNSSTGNIYVYTDILIRVVDGGHRMAHSLDDIYRIQNQIKILNEQSEFIAGHNNGLLRDIKNRIFPSNKNIGRYNDRCLELSSYYTELSSHIGSILRMPRQEMGGLRWSPFGGQIGGFAKLGSGLRHAASSISAGVV